jgi:hypothetical protein
MKQILTISRTSKVKKRILFDGINRDKILENKQIKIAYQQATKLLWKRMFVFQNAWCNSWKIYYQLL